MTHRIDTLLDELFAPYQGLAPAQELRAEIRLDLIERFQDLLATGVEESAALDTVRKSVGNLQEILSDLQEEHMADASRPAPAPAPPGLTQFNASVLRNADLRGVMVEQGNFKASQLRGADFTDAVLRGASFKASDLTDAIFDGADLTGADLASANAKNGSFKGTNLTYARLSHAALRNADLSSAVLVGTQIKFADLRGALFDGNTLTGVAFDGANLTGASFRGTSLTHVSFRHVSRRSVGSMAFGGTTMDRLTYTLLTANGGRPSGDITIL
ncbi:MAG: pentapeptide repeat-containing protein [Bifidobacteriaceae bacterium]|jgi:uncharacterized protein YjbI with pentapeptide repeats|nr:pentapeptide repeat-containing protein [Bifidobacteriaceae bacterium]